MLLPYLVITFGIAWGLLGLFLILPEQANEKFGELSASHPGFVLAVWSPAFAAFAIIAWCSGLRGLRTFLSRLLLWRCPAAWYAYLFIGFPLVFFVGSAMKGNLLTNPFPFDGTAPMLGPMAFMFILGPHGGVRLARRRVAAAAAPVCSSLGGPDTCLIWSTWHLPAFFLSGTPQSAWGVMPFFVGSVCLSIILTPLFNASSGSILLAVIYHFQANKPLWPDAQPYDTYVLVAVAAIVVWLNRRSMFTRGHATTEVIPENRVHLNPDQ